MPSRRSFIVSLFIFATVFSFAQTKNFSIAFEPVFGKSALRLDNSYYLTGKSDSIHFETLKFYISGIELVNDGKTVWKEESSFHLIDASVNISMQIACKIPSGLIFNKVRFNLGIDSTTNVSGAMGSDLDPTKGMYWTWQSGYINFKLEGKSNLCATRNNQLQFHLGGYLYPFNACRTLTLNINGNESTIIVVDVSKLISAIDLSKQNQIMSPGKDAVLLSEKVLRLFTVKQQ